MATSPVIHFLLTYSLEEQALVSIREFRRSDRALAAYREAERLNRGASDKFEVVLLGADSLETIKHTHGNYFPKPADDKFSVKGLLERLTPPQSGQPARIPAG